MNFHLRSFRQRRENPLPVLKMRYRRMKNAVACLSLLLMFNAAGATSYPVNTYATLTAAITASTDGDIISVTANIVVTAEISVTKSLTFSGNNYTITVPVPGVTDAGIVTASPSAFRVFNISASGKTVVFNNLIIKGGGTAASGAAISISTGTIAKFNKCTIANSKAAQGGGVYNQGTCYLFKSHITRNAANYGGGFLNSAGTMYIEYTDISENRSLSASGGGGGCENNSNANLYINNSTFGNNQSTELGGAINNSANVWIANTSFTGNVAYGTYKGGAIAQNASGKTMYLVNCLFGYNYYNNSSGTVAYTLDDIHGYNGTVNLYYCTYMATSVTSGTVTPVASSGNNLHLLATDGSTNDLFTGGSLGQITDATGALYGTFNVYRPFLVNIAGSRVPTLKTGSYALGKGCIVGFTNGNGTPVFGYKNMSTLAWTNLVGTTASSYPVADDETIFTRAATPAVGALERLVDNYVILKVVASANGTVNGASIYGDVYPSGTAVTMTGLPNAGYALTNWTYNLGGTGTVSGNPLTLTLTQNTTLTPNFATSTSYTLTYVGNKQTSGTPPAVSAYTIGATGTLATNSGSLSKTGFTFGGWNTAENGSGTSYAAGASYTGPNVVMYANWISLGTLLEVHLVNFSAVPLNGGKEIQLSWQTASETNSSYYEVQRSKDCSTNWETISKMAAAGNASAMSYYSYVDKQPFSGSFCYRLKEVDKDDKVSYLPVVSVHINDNQAGAINIYPNPSKSIVYMVCENINGAAGISLYSQSGQNVTALCKIIQQTDRKYSIDISKLPAGIYLVKTSSGINKISVL